MKNLMQNYKLCTYATGRVFNDAGWTLDDPQCDKPSLIRANYDTTQITFGAPESGIYRFSDWLPIRRMLKGSAAPITYKSEGLAAELGLKNLYITISGYFPERGGFFKSCSFKETEAYSVCGRMTDDTSRVLVVASAGNTARAFAKVCSENNIPLLLCVPQDNIQALWSEHPINDCVKLVTVESGADYFDAIHLSNVAATGSTRFYAEGGAKNIARRDGMATTMLSAAEVIGHIPDYYFQAVGSGTGAIAAWEANLRLLQDGRFGTNKARLIVSQNAPFQIMYDAWMQHSRALPPYSDATARADAEAIMAKVLSNRQPPYSIAGGLFDALTDTNGVMTAHHNEELCSASELFERTEGIDIHPAAAIAVASLRSFAPQIDPHSTVMINITGAGEQRFKAEHSEIHYLKPSIIFALNTPPEQIIEKLNDLFS